MIPVAEAVERIAGAFHVLGRETVALRDAAGRVLAEAAIARTTQPPADMSSMDGYAVRAEDAAAGATLRVVGTSPAGHPYEGRIGKGEAVRIFTGGVVPDGADAIVIQEDTRAEGDTVTIHQAARQHRHIRIAGLDFKAGLAVAAKGRRLTARDLSLLAAADLAEIPVIRRPRVAFAATGDELSPPGVPRGPGGIVASSGFGLAAMIRQWGGQPIDLGILPDTMDAIASIGEKSRGADLIVTIGGASVGDHDLVQRALGPQGFTLDFWKIAMRPGKPLIFGRLGNTPLLGLPGNPVSTLVCAILFLKPAVARMLGDVAVRPPLTARLSRQLAENDARQDYIRARLEVRDGGPWVDPFVVQDSSMQSTLANADVLIVRAPHAPAAETGEAVEFIPLD